MDDRFVRWEGEGSIAEELFDRPSFLELYFELPYTPLPSNIMFIER